MMFQIPVMIIYYTTGKFAQLSLKTSVKGRQDATTPSHMNTHKVVLDVSHKMLGNELLGGSLPSLSAFLVFTVLCLSDLVCLLLNVLGDKTI